MPCMINSGTTFGTAINCIDGRTQRVVEDWAAKEFGVDWIDSITEPGVDAVLSKKSRFWRIKNNRKKRSLKKKAQISTEKHKSESLVIAGHFDCAGNPVDDITHKEQIRKAVAETRSWKIFKNIVGIWVNKDWQVEKII